MGHHGPSHGFANLVTLVSLELTKMDSFPGPAKMESRWMDGPMDTGTPQLTG